MPIELLGVHSFEAAPETVDLTGMSPAGGEAAEWQPRKGGRGSSRLGGARVSPARDCDPFEIDADEVQLGGAHLKARFVDQPSRLLALVLAVVAMTSLHPADAQMPRSGFDQFRHDSWMIYEGAPAGMRMVAQTPDGWIWVSAAEGLFRFDGVTFERIHVPAGSPLERASAGPLFVSRSGDLWVGFDQFAGIGLYRNGRLHHVPMPQPPQVVRNFAETSDGAMWVTSGFDHYRANRLWRLTKGRWEDLSTNAGLREGYIAPPCATADGSLWVPLIGPDNFSGIFRLSRGDRRFELSPLRPAFNARCFSDRQGRLWIIDGLGIRMVTASDGTIIARPRTLATVPGVAAAVWGEDSSGGFWGRTKESTGIFYVPGAGGDGRNSERIPDRFLASDGLSSDLVHQLYVDRDENTWVVTETGLDRFRRAVILQEPFLERDRERIDISQNGQALYVGVHDGLFQIYPGPPRSVLPGKASGQCPARDEGVWVLDITRIVRFRDGSQQSVPAPDGVELSQSCVEDRLGRLWVATVDDDLIWYDRRGWHARPPTLPKLSGSTLIVTPSGDIAYIAATGELVRVAGNRVSRISLDAYNNGVITTLAARGSDLLLSGNNGLLRLRGRQVARLDWRRFPWVARLRGLLQTSRGDTWMLQRYAVSRVSTAALDRAFDDPNAQLERDVLDLRDGLGAIQNDLIYGPQMAVGGDGRIWLLNRSGPSFVDPSQFPRKAPPPPVVIRSLASARALFHDPSRVTLPAGTHGLDIAYTALSYAYPERVRFRYRLEGVDDAWVDAEDRRLASYANLGPGHYRFRVIASDDQRRWSDPGAVLEIEIPPTFLQSWPFKLLCGLAALGLLWLAYSLRLRVVAGRIRMAMAERTAERERIARELHDTLLQGIQGLMLRFQVVADRIDDPLTRRALDHALDQADAVAVEGRERVRDLRSAGEPDEVAEELAKLARSIVADATWPIGLTVEGEERPLQPLVRFEALCIAEEAVRNAILHAGPGPISLSLRYDRKQFRLGVRDEGHGIPDAVLGEGKRAGHFGLVGMRERARRIGGQLAIVTATGAGTEITLAVPARTAYLGARRPYLASLLAIARNWRLR